MAVLVTGGSGYFGSLLLRKLVAQGERCRVFDLNDADDRPQAVDFIKGDIRECDAITRACEGMDVVHHNVAQVPLAKDRTLFESVNVLGTRNLLDAALSTGVRKVVYTSSSAVYGVPSHNPVTEDMPPSPDEAYGKAKYEGELLCGEYIGRGLDVTIIRPRTIMGHGRLGIFQILFEWIRGSANVPVLGRGDNLYQFVHADDLAEACILAGQRAEPATYNCGTHCFGTMREVLQRLCDHARTGSKVKGVPMSAAIVAMQVASRIGFSPLGAYHALMYGRSMHFDITKARNELGWQPRYSNDEMFIQSYDWYLENREMVLANHHASHHRSAVKQGILRVLPWVL